MSVVDFLIDAHERLAERAGAELRAPDPVAEAVAPRAVYRRTRDGARIVVARREGQIVFAGDLAANRIDPIGLPAFLAGHTPEPAA